MPNIILFDRPGSSSVLRMADQPIPKPGRGEILIRQCAVGVNFIDIYHRSGLYALSAYPSGLGVEAAGVVEACGEDAAMFQPGDRVAYARGPVGAYAQYCVIATPLAVKLPDAMPFEIAAACMLKGLTAQYLLRRTFCVGQGHSVLIHAAAGGVGLLLCQWAKHLGATVIGTVGSAEKAALARKNGCDHTIIYTSESVSQRVRGLTAGRGVEVVYDSVGKATFMDSLDCLRPFGTMVSFGQSSGPVPPLDIAILSQKGSLYLTRPTLFTHAADSQWYQCAAAELFDLIGQGALTVRIHATLPLAEAAQAHDLLESRVTSGAVVLIP